jgi:hypothetical protein
VVAGDFNCECGVMQAIECPVLEETEAIKEVGTPTV